MKNFRFLLAIFVFGLLAVSSGFAASKKKPALETSHGPVITSASATSITITEAKTTKTLGITQFTDITVNGQKATAAELKPGMGVNVTLGTDPTKAARINATGK